VYKLSSYLGGDEADDDKDGQKSGRDRGSADLVPGYFYTNELRPAVVDAEEKEEKSEAVVRQSRDRRQRDGSEPRVLPSDS
jgi:hypothetical protein